MCSPSRSTLTGCLQVTPLEAALLMGCNARPLFQAVVPLLRGCTKPFWVAHERAVAMCRTLGAAMPGTLHCPPDYAFHVALVHPRSFCDAVAEELLAM